jgi:hypothetical protein
VLVRVLLALRVLVPELQEFQGSLVQGPQIQMQPVREPRERVQPARWFAVRQFSRLHHDCRPNSLG